MKANIKQIGAVSTAAALVAGSMVAIPMAQQAFADSTVTIASETGETGGTYKAFQVFTGTVTGVNDKGANGKISEPKFVSTSVRAAFEKTCDTAQLSETAAADYATYKTEKAKGDQASAAQLAQLAVKIVNSELKPGVDAENDPAAPTAGSFGYIFAQELAKIESATNMSPNGEGVVSAELAAGYWLIVADNEPNSGSDDPTKDAAATGPIFIAVDGMNAVTVTQKKAVPTLTKQVHEDDAAEGTWGKAADQTKGKTLDFKLEGTIASNYDAYSAYKYVITDDPTGLTIDKDSIKVSIGSTDVTTALGDKVSISADGVLTIAFDDLKAFAKAQSVTVTAATTITVTYTATVTGTGFAENAPAGQNTASLEYSNKPGTNESGHTTPDKTTVKNYEFTLAKTKADGTALKGAVFSIKTPDNEYIVKDGELVNRIATEGNVTISSDDATFKIDGLDSGTYIVEEVSAPDGYNKIMEKFQVVIGNDGTVATKTEAGNVINNASLLDQKVTLEGTTVKVANSEGLELPVTGQQGFMLLTIAGGIVLAVSLGGVVLRKRKVQTEAND